MKRGNYLGELGEIVAMRHLRDKGYILVKNNYRSRFGEIDLIVENKKYIVFVEVKLRNEKGLIRGIQAVDGKKQRKIITTATQFLCKYEKELQPRFDVVEITTDEKHEIMKIEHYENAFEGE